MNIIKDGIIGLAIGDAMGVPLEFLSREKLQQNITIDMKGYGTHNVKEGTWSDDTSMTLAFMDSYIEHGKIDYEDIMIKFNMWYRRGMYTTDGNVFDIGNTCYNAINKYYEYDINPIECGSDDIYSNGNGSLMRILPLAYIIYYNNISDEKEIYTLVKNISSLTHRNDISVLGCYIYIMYVLSLLNGKDKIESYRYIRNLKYDFFEKQTINMYERILESDISKLNMEDILSSGYIVHSLEASLWSILTTNSYDDAIIKSINLGEDTDTIGAITGSIAGILYGYETFPNKWITKMQQINNLEEYCNKFEKKLIKDGVKNDNKC